MVRRIIMFFILTLLVVRLHSQNNEEIVVKSIFDNALTDRTSYENLRYLCEHTKGRIAGSPQAAEAVEYTFQLLNQMDLDTVYLQPVKVPHWVRGEKEECSVLSSRFANRTVAVAALGMSVGTGNPGLSAGVVEVHNFDELAKLGEDKIKGKIVFYNRPMDPTLINTFSAYSGAADQRTQGASKAAEFGATGVVIRSLTTALDDHPHTGVMRYDEKFPQIPAVAICTNGAEQLSSLLKEDPDLKLFFRTTCKTYSDVNSFNVIGELKGSEFPNRIITVGGHIDAWENGEGAHDDGSGCVQAIEVLRLFKKLGIKPKCTIRAVLFMDEEIAQRGGKEYARQAELKNEIHWFALESDRGGLQPRGFGITAPEGRLTKMLSLEKYFEPYGIEEFTSGGGGVDISPLGKSGTPLCSFVPDMQRYFDYHHSSNDSFDKVNIRELQMGSAAIASLIYLIDLFGY
jgi:carboxypeptidase Q